MNERGQVAAMVAGLALVCFALAGLAVDGTRAFLFRRTLQNGADASALAGASELDESLFRSGDGAVVLAQRAAGETARSFVSRRALAVTADVDASTDRVRVLLAGRMSTTFLALVGIDTLPVSAVAEAVPVEGAP